MPVTCFLPKIMVIPLDEILTRYEVLSLLYVHAKKCILRIFWGLNHLGLG